MITRRAGFDPFPDIWQAHDPLLVGCQAGKVLGDISAQHIPKGFNSVGHNNVSPGQLKKSITLKLFKQLLCDEFCCILHEIEKNPDF